MWSPPAVTTTYGNPGFLRQQVYGFFVLNFAIIFGLPGKSGSRHGETSLAGSFFAGVPDATALRMPPRRPSGLPLPDGGAACQFDKLRVGSRGPRDRGRAGRPSLPRQTDTRRRRHVSNHKKDTDLPRTRYRGEFARSIRARSKWAAASSIRPTARNASPRLYSACG